MTYLFEVIDRTGRKIRLPTERWKHIVQEHPYIQNIEEIREAVINPLRITPSKYDPEQVRYYYRFDKNRKRYLLVAIKHLKMLHFWCAESLKYFRAYLNGDGFIITAFFRRNIQ